VREKGELSNNFQVSGMLVDIIEGKYSCVSLELYEWKQNKFIIMILYI